MQYAKYTFYALLDSICCPGNYLTSAPPTPTKSFVTAGVSRVVWLETALMCCRVFGRAGDVDVIAVSVGQLVWRRRLLSALRHLVLFHSPICAHQRFLPTTTHRDSSEFWKTAFTNQHSSFVPLFTRDLTCYAYKILKHLRGEKRSVLVYQI